MLCSVLCKCLPSVTGHFSKGILSPHPVVRGPRMPPSVNGLMPALNNRKIHLTIVKYMLICKYGISIPHTSFLVCSSPFLHHVTITVLSSCVMNVDVHPRNFVK